MAALAHKGQIIMGGDNGVTSWNGRSGSILPMAGDYDATQINYDSSTTVKDELNEIEDDIDGINLLDVNLADLKSIPLNGGTWNGNVYTQHGVTFTFNSEDKSISINGTATAKTDFYLLKGSSGTSRPISELQSEMLLSGIKGDNDFYIQIVYRNASDAYLSQQNLTSGELAIEIPSNAFGYRIVITIANGKTVTNAVVKPMLTEAKYAGIPYHPYNQQSIQNQINDVTGVWTSPVSCLVGDTTATISNAAIHTTSTINPYIQTTSGAVVAYSNLAITEGQAVITFGAALTEAASVKLQILNI